MTQTPEPDTVVGDLEALGASLRSARALHGMTQDELSHASGVARQTISRAESGGSITTPNLFRLLAALGIALSDVCLKRREARR